MFVIKEHIMNLFMYVINLVAIKISLKNVSMVEHFQGIPGQMYLPKIRYIIMRLIK